jgi:hypothetical protein
MKLKLRYAYDFYNNGELVLSDFFEDTVEILTAPVRFTLHDQEDATFIVSELKHDHLGDFVTLTYPNKDNVVVHKDESEELTYDEYYSVMGDDNHNVYEGSIRLED